MNRTFYLSSDNYKKIQFFKCKNEPFKCKGSFFLFFDLFLGRKFAEYLLSIFTKRSVIQWKSRTQENVYTFTKAFALPTRSLSSSVPTILLAGDLLSIRTYNTAYTAGAAYPVNSIRTQLFSLSTGDKDAGKYANLKIIGKPKYSEKYHCILAGRSVMEWKSAGVRMRR